MKQFIRGENNPISNDFPEPSQVDPQQQRQQHGMGWEEPLFDPGELGSIIPTDPKKPFDVRKVIFITVIILNTNSSRPFSLSTFIPLHSTPPPHKRSLQYENPTHACFFEGELPVFWLRAVPSTSSYFLIPCR